MQTDRPWRLPLVALYAAPWAALVCLAIFVAAVSLKVGHFPSYSHPDPKHVGGLNWLYLATMLLLGLALLSPALVALHAVWARLAGREQIGGWRAACYAAGMGFVLFVVVGDAFKLRTWLLD